MNWFDFLVLIGSMLGIALYGVWHTRDTRDLTSYLKGDHTVSWFAIGVSVMATQASAVTFISMPGQGYESGITFVQNYFGLPLALILVSVAFLPIYRSLGVYTAYEYLGRRFDARTRRLGAGLFLIQRGLAAGFTIYAPGIILSSMLAWRLDLTIVFSGLLCTLYTVAGGSRAVSLTQRHQMAIISGAMCVAFALVLAKLPRELSLSDALTIAGGMGKLDGVSFSVDPKARYTFWSGLLGGFFLSLSYFGTDQSQVQRYLTGGSLRESRMGLMFNAVLKIPMQFFILFLGVLLFLFYQFQAPPVVFNQLAWRTLAGADADAARTGFDRRFAEVHAKKRDRLAAWLAARHRGDAAAEAAQRDGALAAQKELDAVRGEARKALLVGPNAKASDSDYVFVTFVLSQLPHGVIGLLIAAFIAATLQSKAAELNALGSATTVDIYRDIVVRDASDEHYVAATRWFTLMWGLVAIAFALSANMAENLIQAVNIVGSIFYGVVLALFLVALFLPRVGGTAVFWGALAAQALVFVLYATLDIGYLWFNVIGCLACMGFSLAIQLFVPPEVRA